jgi:hypothetical protein
MIEDFGERETRACKRTLLSANSLSDSSTSVSCNTCIGHIDMGYPPGIACSVYD